jgi:hypothetical protein
MAEAASQILFEAGLDVSNYIYAGNPREVLVRISEKWPGRPQSFLARVDCITESLLTRHRGFRCREPRA